MAYLNNKLLRMINTYSTTLKPPEYSDVANFLTVYISEAHPTDEWEMRGHKYQLKQHVSLQDRILASKNIFENKDLNLPGNFAIDLMDNTARSLYGATPERLYVVYDGIIVYVGIRGPVGYKVKEVEDWLRKYSASS